MTSITFTLPPSQLDVRLNDDDLWITLDGVESNGDGTGTLLQNPSDIIQAIHTRWMGMPSANIDADSFAAAKTATSALQMGFALTEQKKGLELCADLAFQARCSEVFFGGQAQLIFLTNVMTPSGTPPTIRRGPLSRLAGHRAARMEPDRHGSHRRVHRQRDQADDHPAVAGGGGVRRRAHREDD